METVNLRDFAPDKHQTVDDAPFGGGAGMVMRPDVIHRAFDHHYDRETKPLLLYMSPRGRILTQNDVKTLAKQREIGVLCGRFEGVDQRVLDAWSVDEISIGDYVLSGGELASMVLMDACARLIPGVLGSQESLENESFSHGLLEHPHFTRPQVWNGVAVPDVLVSGHHEKVAQWRQDQSETLTQNRRPDLWERHCLLNSLKSKKDGV